MALAVPQQDYFFHGCRLRSAIPLASLAPWPASAPESASVVTLTAGEAPHGLDDPIWSSPFIQIARDKSVLVNIAAVARFYLPNGRDIVVQPAPGAQTYEIESIFLTTVAGLLLHQRSTLPLQASCIALDGRAIAISGPAGYGKSALAAALVQRGAALLADDLCVLDLSQPTPHVASGSAHCRIWPDVMEHLGITKEQRLPTRLNHGKHAVALPACPPGGYPLTHLVRIAMFTTSVTPELVPLHGPGSVLPVRRLVFQRDIGHLLGNASIEFRALTALASRVRIFSLRRTQPLQHLDPCVDLILNAASGEA
jgi:hypothetical protein